MQRQAAHGCCCGDDDRKFCSTKSKSWPWLVFGSPIKIANIAIDFSIKTRCRDFFFSQNWFWFTNQNLPPHAINCGGSRDCGGSRERGEEKSKLYFLCVVLCCVVKNILLINYRLIIFVKVCLSKNQDSPKIKIAYFNYF